MKKAIAAVLILLIASPAFAADPVPVSSPPVVSGPQDEADRTTAHATVAVTAALIAVAIIYATKDRQTLNLKPTKARARVYVDQNARVGVAFDL